jgi:hypothetical protein
VIVYNKHFESGYFISNIFDAIINYISSKELKMF